MSLYGWYFGMFLDIIIEGLWARRRRSKVLIWVTKSLFVVTTLNIIICAADEYNAWLKHHTHAAVMAYFFTRTSEDIKLVSYVLIQFAETLADSLLLWRLYVIWNKNKLIAMVPAALLVSDFVIGTTVCVMALVTRNDYRGARYTRVFFTLDIIDSGNAILLNGFCTTFIILRLWWVGRRTSTPHGRSLYKAVIISLVESGALFTVTLILFTIFILGGYDNLGALFKYLLIMAIAIAPMFIVTHLNEQSPSPSTGIDHSVAEGEVVLSAPVRSDFSTRSHENTRDKPRSTTRMVFSPVETFQLKTFRSSRSQDDSQPSSTASAHGNGVRENIPVTVPSLSSSAAEIQLRLEHEEVDQDDKKADFGLDEDEEGVMPLSSPGLATGPEYFSRKKMNGGEVMEV
ncbi:hypothetical protein FRB97_006876 [Tulasnella sp. 331]|nr:hypothetical protein FRB97_006876 [Tulasnella sp. 331]